MCDKTHQGIWTAEQSRLDDQHLEQHNAFLRCHQCGDVYCHSCFIALETRRPCQSCQTKLKGAALDILMTDPQLQINRQLGEVKLAEQELDSTVETICEMQCTTNYKPPWVGSKDEWKNLGEQGQVAYQFHNTALQIGKK